MLALFAEGIAGRTYHIKSRRERVGSADVGAVVEAGERLADDDGADATHDGRSLYLPDAVAYFDDERLNGAIYRLTVLDQLGFREFGTYRFDLDAAWRRIPALAGRTPDAGYRESDLGIFFNAFAHPAIARRLFRIVETARVQAAVERRYPGTRKYRRALQAHLDTIAAGAGDELEALRGALAGLSATQSRLLPLAAEVLSSEADVYTSAAATVACFDALGIESETAANGLAGPDKGLAMEWLQREARLEDWDEELAQLEGEVAVLEFATEEGRQAKVGETQEVGGELREVGKALIAERDQLKRRIDMERAAVRHALGDEREGATSFRYDEWDYHNGVYLRGWCRLYEEPLQATQDTDSQALLDAVRPFAKAVRRQFELVRPGGYQRVRKTPDGDELDLDAIVETRADVRAGNSPDERVYSRRERLRRDVAAAFLVDLSASTDDILPEEREPAPTENSNPQDIRDPFFNEDEDYDFEARMAADASRRRIIDIQRESALLMATALEGLGDRYGVYGFSGYGRNCVEFYVAKEFDQPFDQGVLDAIAAMKPKRSTRMGPAVRHAVAKLEASGAALKVLLIVSDGFPQDHDYGPNRGEHEYGVQDTARALLEAQARNIETFCVTVDCSSYAKGIPSRSPAEGSHDYLRRMCPDHRYMVIEETAELPDALQKAYRQLTRF